MTQRPWQERLDDVYEMMHEMSRQSEPQEMVRSYGKRVRKLFPVDRHISISRRDLEYPKFRITRNSEWTEEINPWTQKDRLPLLSGGMCADLIYNNRPVIIDELDIPEDDPIAEYLKGQKSLIAIPMLDNGEALNMNLSTQTKPRAFDRETFPETVWLSNLFGRATYNLVLRKDISKAYETIDRELKIVSGIQRSLLPKEMPKIKNFELAAHYETSQRAGGDYYDFFPLTENKWGILIADVSGHGTPAAVVMAITHSIAHLFPQETGKPGELLKFVNNHLANRYTDGIEAFVTAFYGVYDSQDKTLTFANAGHNPPRIWKCNEQRALSLEGSSNLPLGIMPDLEYEDDVFQLHSGDRLVLYTDGITEASSPDGELFETDRLDKILTNSCLHGSYNSIDSIIAAVNEHTQYQPAHDDRTLVVGRVS